MRPAVVGPEGTGGIAGRGFSRTGVINYMVFEIIRQRVPGIQALFELGMGDVPGDDNFSGQQQRRCNRILTELLPYSVHGPVQIDTFSRLTGNFNLREVSGRIGFQLLQEDAIPRNFGFDIAIRAAADAQADRTGCAVPR